MPNPEPAPLPAEERRVMLLQDGGRDLMLPAGAVAELIAADALRGLPAAPSWLLGVSTWRGRWVPTVTLDEQRRPLPRRLALARLVICLTPSGNAQLPYLAFFSRALPRLERVTAASLIPDPQPHPLALAGLRFGGLPAWIPDLDALEAAVLSAREQWDMIESN